MCTLHDILSSKSRFIHTSTHTGLHSCSGKNYAYASRTSCYFNVSSWKRACRFNENSYYAYSKKTTKNRQGETCDKNNYRPIAIVISLSKIIELCIMRVIDAQLVTSHNQLGFKREHGTDICVYTVKSVIKYYNMHTCNSHVHTWFLDASKAYDRVNHWTLFKKLLDRSVHILVVRMLMFWYTRQELCIRWGAEMSSFFTISNRVRQGRILSPFLFAVYMDTLSSLLNASRIGCHISDVCINHVFYADDLCLMAPVL